MAITELILMIGASVGLTVIVTCSSSFSGFRSFFLYSGQNKVINKIFKFFHKLFTCSLCFGTWAGVLVYLIKDLPYSEPVIFGLTSAAVAFFYTKKLKL